MGPFTVDFSEVDQSMTAVVGGKGAGLGELSRIGDVRVPDGFCVTTDAFRQAVAGVDLSGDASAVREAIEAAPMPAGVEAAIVGALGRPGEEIPCVVRSSATAEDLPTASFAGLQDTYLDVRGREAILDGVRCCWASLFTERALAYREQNGFDHGAVAMAVVVQRMVSPTAAGTLFTADPLSGNRRIASIEAVRGLGEALVSGQVNADGYKVRDGRVIESAPVGEPVLADAQAVELAELGRRIAEHLGRPQDIEWCLDDEGFAIVQSRAITTLFPIPAAPDDGPHAYVSVGHQQMMTDAMKPLGLSFWQMTAARPMFEAGGRLFVDVTRELASMNGRANLAMLGKSDPLVRDALETVMERDFVPAVADDAEPGETRLAGAVEAEIETDPAIVTELIEGSQASIAALRREIEGLSGTELLDFIREDIEVVGKQRLFDPRGLQVIMAGMGAAWWLNEKLEEWLGERNAADTLSQSAPGNVTSEMGLALLDVADAVRPHPEVVAFLQRVEDEGGHEGFLDELPGIPGGAEARAAIDEFLATYGARCVGEIDITRPRWAERPTTLVPMILGNVRNFEPGAGARRFEKGRKEAEREEREVVARLRQMPDEEKAAETEAMIKRLRTFAGYREYPKFGKVSRDFVYKRAVMREAERLAREGVLGEPEDVFYLRFDELADAVRDGRADTEEIRRRKEEFRAFEALTPPRVLTSEGEMLFGSYQRDGAPDGALVGQPVSAGTIEGRARVVLDIAEADLEPGDILVTRFTDPSWTPVFVAIAGLVTEVGGLMTHGAVIAREYGLPAIVGVDDATRLIEDGRRIRIDGTDGYVEFLD